MRQTRNHLLAPCQYKINLERKWAFARTVRHYTPKRWREKMRKLESYIKKYGPIEGKKMFTRLQREAALASAHARHKKSLARKGR